MLAPCDADACSDIAGGGRGYNQDNQERDEAPQAASDIRLKAELPAHAKVWYPSLRPLGVTMQGYRGGIGCRPSCI